jgi:hypothetical protein
MSDLKHLDMTSCKVIQYRQALVDHSDRPVFSPLLFSPTGTLRLCVCFLAVTYGSLFIVLSEIRTLPSLKIR